MCRGLSTLTVVVEVLDPNHKLSYFEDSGWSQDWIDTAKSIAREEYNRNYASIGDELSDKNNAAVPSEQDQAPKEVSHCETRHITVY